MHALRGAIVGFGFIAERGHLPTYLKDAQNRASSVQIVAIADTSPERLKLASQLLPHARLYRDFIQLLELERGTLDFVDIATPPVEHAPIARLALDAGLHVLCEKPLTLTARDAHELLRRAVRARRVLYPVHNYKYSPVARAVNEILSSGEIGTVRSVTLQTFRNTHALGVPAWMPDWRRDPARSGGGIAMDHGPHSLYLAFDWMRGLPESVTATVAHLKDDTFTETEDSFSAVYRFPSGWVTLQLSWASGVRKTLYTVQGERGAILIEDDSVEVALQRPAHPREHNGAESYGGVQWDIKRRDAKSEWMDASHREWFAPLFEDFQRAIVHAEFAGPEAIAAVQCIEAIEAAYASAANQSRVELIRFGHESGKPGAVA